MKFKNPFHFDHDTTLEIIDVINGSILITAKYFRGHGESKQVWKRVS